MAGIIFGGCYLTKEPGLFVGIAFGMYAVVRRQWRIGCGLAAGCALVILGEVSWYWLASGDPLFRPHAMAVHNASQEAVEANVHLAYRLWKVYPRMMILPDKDFGIHSLAAISLAAIAVWFWRSSYKLLLLLWIALPYLYLNFGTTNFSHYWALPSAPRYLALIYPPLFVLAAVALTAFMSQSTARTFAAYVALAGIGAIGIGCAINTRHTGYRAPAVGRLKEIAVMARHTHGRVCEFAGPNGAAWRSAFAITSSDVIGCSAPSATVRPDSSGLPSAELFFQETTFRAADPERVHSDRH